MLIRNSLILILIFSFAEAKIFEFNGENFDLELMTNNTDLNLIKFKHKIDEINDIEGNLDFSNKQSST